MALQRLPIVRDSEYADVIVRFLKGSSSDGHVLEILEAGCGRRWPFKLDGVPYRLTGIDLDEEALSIRQRTEQDLHHAIHGDLRTADLPEASYDAIYNSYVLEHVDGAERVLGNFVKWLKPGGTMVIAIPDRSSAYGFFARHTPHWFHVWFYRYVGGNRNAGKPGYAPYPTYYDEVVSREGIRRFAREQGLHILAEYGYYKPPGAIGMLTDLVHWGSLGRLASDHTNLLFVIRKPAPR